MLAAACALHANGQETEDTAEAADRLGRALGLSALLVLRWDEVLLQAETTDGYAGLRSRAVTPTTVGMNRVAGVMHCMEAVCAADLPPADADEAIGVAAARPPSALPLFVLACAAGASALALIFGAVHPRAVAMVALSAGAGGMLRRLLSRQGAGPVLQAFAAAILAGVVGAWAVRLGVSSTLRLVAICPCMILVPGPHILNGALDVIALRIPLGAARLAFASLVLSAICGGLLIGLALGGTTLPVSEPSRQVPLWIDTLAAGVAAASYGVYFSMPIRTLGWPILVGMAAHAVRWWAMSSFGVHAPIGAGIACILVGAVVAPVAKRLRLPFAAVGFASVVSLMPGIVIFRMSSALVEFQLRGSTTAPGLVLDFMSDAATATLIVMAMTLGLVVPKNLYRRCHLT